MINLTNFEEIKKLDPKNVYGSTEMFTDQCQQIVDTYFDVEFFTPEYKAIKNIVICGMGGSAYGGHIILSLFKDKLKVPLYVNSGYHLPGFVNESTLVILTSYSGETEEVLSCAGETVERGAKITGFSSGGRLSNLLEEYPGFTFNPQHNPSGQPRLGTGYVVLGTIALLNSLGVIHVLKEEVLKAIDEVRRAKDDIQGKAQVLAQQLANSIPVIFAAEHLTGNAHIMRNQFNETAKSFSTFSELPELNHHLMEGLKNPPDKKLVILFLLSALYTENIQNRMGLTKEVAEKNNVKLVDYQAQGQSKIAQVLNVLSFGGWVSLYLALIYGQDPSLIPWVDWFKEKLSGK